MNGVALRIVSGVLALWLVAQAAANGASTQDAGGRRITVIDAVTGTPIAGAMVTADDGQERRTGADGVVHVSPTAGGGVKARAYGYWRNAAPSGAPGSTPMDIRLQPVRPKALYLSFYGIGSRVLRSAALELIDTTALNALVIDVKGDRGLIAFRSNLALARTAGAQTIITIPDLPGLVSSLHERGIYAIARIVVFKDHPLALARPDLAVHRRDGAIFTDREGLAWTSALSQEVRDYNIGVAVEAAQAGFDEIQFDYVRLPDASDAVFQSPWTAEHREAAITGFLREARQRLIPFNVFLAADVFGYVCWNQDDTKIGQRLESLGDVVDYISPMLYPSSFQFGIPGFRNPVQTPYDIVSLSLQNAQARIGSTPLRFRPWLQAFRDYAFGGVAFDADKIAAQIDAAEKCGADGWMLWNPQNRYSPAGLDR